MLLIIKKVQHVNFSSKHPKITEYEEITILMLGRKHWLVFCVADISIEFSMPTSHKLLQAPSPDSQLILMLTTWSRWLANTSNSKQQLVANLVICCPLFVLCMNCHGPSIAIKEAHDLFETTWGKKKDKQKLNTFKKKWNPCICIFTSCHFWSPPPTF